ncbi:MAG: PD-(D/E)XK nuclease family protein, partial [Nitrospinota bacterium]
LKKSAGHDEERLLFTLALASGRERVVLTRQRSGEEGKPLVRSWYVHELARALGHREGELPGALHVPRSLAERFRGGITSEAFWTPSEWTARLLLQDRNPEALHAVRGLAPGVLAGCFEAGVQLKGLRGELTGRDGMTGGLPDLWKEFRKRGWSPTALEEYARCPFRFFADRVLGLEELEGLEEVAETEARDTGSLLHAILQRFFSRWSEGASADASRLLSEVVDSALDAFQEENPVGYPLLWERTREEIRSLAEGYVEGELRSLEESGYRPVAFEEDAEAALPDVPGAPSILRGMKIRGRLDRIDRREDGGEARLRVVDYKYRSGTTPPSPNLAQSALRARTLQPAFYVLLAEARERGAKAGAELHYLAPRWPEGDDRRRAFPPEAWETAWAAEMLDTVERLLKGIRAGSFYIIPDGDEFGYCAHCPYRPLCRKNHRPTRYRQKADPRTHAVEKLREKKWSPKS